jgi:CHAD domain-containing protein
MTDQELLAENPEALHEFRVAVRTLRTRLKFYAPFFRNSAKIARWLKELKWLDAQIQPLRELEVQIEIFDEITQDKLQNLVSKPGKHQDLKKKFAALRVELTKPLFDTRQKMQFALLSARKHQLIADIKTGLLLAQMKPKKLLDLEATLALELTRRAEKLEKLISKPKFAKQSFKKLHVARLSYKRTRYLAEALGLPSKTFADGQDVLGEINDLAHLVAWLRARVAKTRRNRRLLLSLIITIDGRIDEKRVDLETFKGA